MQGQTQTIRKLNDKLRRHSAGGSAVITAGVAALGRDTVDRIVRAIAVFDDFSNANDPYEEHDFGSLEVEGETIFFKIDYYDKSFSGLSPDPADPAATERVITIMLAQEY